MPVQALIGPLSRLQDFREELGVIEPCCHPVGPVTRRIEDRPVPAVGMVQLLVLVDTARELHPLRQFGQLVSPTRNDFEGMPWRKGATAQ